MARFTRKSSAGSHSRGPWKHGAIPVIGLIGGVGAGKSEVASALAERGAHVLDADVIGHVLLDQKPARDQVLKQFGEQVLDRSAADGSTRVDRKALGEIVFAQPKALKDLEAILHPRMMRTFQRAIARDVRNQKATAVVLDAAVLLEAGWNKLCDVVVFVDAPREQRLARLESQRGWASEELDARERAQWPLEQKRQRAHHVIMNDADPSALQERVGGLWNTIVKESRPASAAGAPKQLNPASATRSRPV
jgi:dephospho-CoA kinase